MHADKRYDKWLIQMLQRHNEERNRWKERKESRDCAPSIWLVCFSPKTFAYLDKRMEGYVQEMEHTCGHVEIIFYTGCPRRNGQNFGRVFLMLNYTDITQNTYIQSWTVTGIMAIEKCGLLGCPRSVRRPWRHTCTLRMPGNETPLANVAMQWPWRDYASAAACVKCLVTLRTTMTWVRVFL